jgi:23S rRNA (adenine2030-N6)-methyltransferase
MNYRHAYHAGNFADVLKHIVLVQGLEHLKKKPAPFRVIDSHAGIGRYRLDAKETALTGEWRDGIARVLAEAPKAPATALRVLQPYLDVVAASNTGHEGLLVYPGSPQITASLLRRGDTLVANELHKDDSKRLAKNFEDDRQVKVMTLDGWTALKSLLPPHERRGLVLVDPPYEEPGELRRLTEALGHALDRFKSGLYLLWYPIKDPKHVQRFRRGIIETATAAGIETVLDLELLLRAPRNPDLLNGCGVIVVNPPFTLQADMAAILPLLAQWFAAGPGAAGTVHNLLSVHS